MRGWPAAVALSALSAYAKKKQQTSHASQKQQQLTAAFSYVQTANHYTITLKIKHPVHNIESTQLKMLQITMRSASRLSMFLLSLKLEADSTASTICLVDSYVLCNERIFDRLLVMHNKLFMKNSYISL